MDELSISGSVSPIPIDFGTRHTRKSSESDDDMNTGLNSEPDNVSTRPSTPHTVYPGSTAGSIPSGVQLAQLQNSHNVMTSPYLPRTLNNTRTMQIPAHLLQTQGQIVNTDIEVNITIYDITLCMHVVSDHQYYII